MILYMHTCNVRMNANHHQSDKTHAHTNTCVTYECVDKHLSSCTRAKTTAAHTYAPTYHTPRAAMPALVANHPRSRSASLMRDGSTTGRTPTNHKSHRLQEIERVCAIIECIHYTGVIFIVYPTSSHIIRRLFAKYSQRHHSVHTCTRVLKICRRHLLSSQQNSTSTLHQSPITGN